MKLIIETGSTKTDCAVISDSFKSISRKTLGLNPVTGLHFTRNLQKILCEYQKYPITSIFYYGAGCINRTINKKVKNEIAELMGQQVNIEVYEDLFGAARGVLHSAPGIICILGTGSNIGYYNGTAITDKISSGGYLLGDEGSGFRLGQQLYTRWVRGQLTSDMEQLLTKKYGITKENALFALYQSDDPRRFLASFAPSVQDLQKELYHRITNDVFSLMVQNMVLPLYVKHKTRVSFGGSISYHFKDIIQKKLEKFNIIADLFCPSPLEGLLDYHVHD